MSLEQEIAKKRKENYTETLSMSVGELIGLYEKKELDIHPKFQRFLRWSEEQKTKLIESILLRIPIPQIFVAQDARGYWDVVDGMQRLGTIFEFVGILRDEEEVAKKPLVLSDSKLIPGLAGKVFENPHAPNEAFPPSLRLEFKRSRLDMVIILKESDPTSKYELFMRLNTGGSLASRQEVRNCLMVWTNEPFYDWLAALGRDANFQNCTSLSEKMEKENYGLELILRFLLLRRMPDQQLIGIGHIGDFLDKKLVELATEKNFDYGAQADIFRRTFSVINLALGELCFRKYERANDRFRGGFLISAFEAIALGVAQNISQVEQQSREWLSERIKDLWDNAEFRDYTGIGVSAGSRIIRTIPIGRRLFKP